MTDPESIKALAVEVVEAWDRARVKADLLIATRNSATAPMASSMDDYHACALDLYQRNLRIDHAAIEQILADQALNQVISDLALELGMLTSSAK